VEVLGLIEVLWRRRIAVAVGALVAIAIAFAIGTKPPTSYGVGWARVVLDTPESQTVDTKPSGADTLVWRASLLVHLLATDESKRELARKLGIRPDDLAVTDPAITAPEAPASLPSAAAKLAAINPAPYALTVYRSTDLLPMISFEAAAPDAREAARLVRAAIATVKSESHLGERVPQKLGADGKLEDLPVDQASIQGFVIQDVAPPRAKKVLNGGSPVVALMAGFMVFWMWAACVAVGPRLLRVAQAQRRSIGTEDPEPATR
jgi:hypothetical protein